MSAPTALPAQRLGQQFDNRHAHDVWEVVQQVQSGDTAAFAVLYERYRHNLARFVYGRTHDATLTEDLVSATFEKALRSIGQFRWQGRDFGAWLTTIARNLIIDHHKSLRVQRELTFPEMADWDHADDCDTEATALDGMTAEVLRQALTRLVPSQRALIEHRYFEGLRYAEIGRRMGISTQAAKALQFRAVGALARALRDGVDDRGAPPAKLIARY